MTKKMLIDATHAEETRVVVLDGNKVDEFDFESLNKRQLSGNIYLAKVTRVEPSLQAAFVEYGGNRHGFLAFSEIHPDYYQIPKSDRDALLAEEAEIEKQAKDEEDETEPATPRRRRSRSRRRSEPSEADDTATATGNEDNPEGDDAAQDEAGSERIEAAADTDAVISEPAAPASDEDEDDGVGLVETPEGDGAYESVGGEDDVEEVRPARKPRPRRYKIQEVIKVRQILLVQVVKEERGNKGAALTTYLSLAGRYCVLMPNTARGGGISRKITNASDRKKLKEISSEITVPQGAGLIIRTAGAQRTRTEIKRDYEYLLRQWEQIRDETLKSIAPCLIYEEGSLVKRAIRDLYSRDIEEVLVDGERGYREAKDYMKMLMPSHAKNVKHYTDSLPLFSRHQVESYLAGMFNPVVQLKSGGYIVIDVTEALVAIDVNSGRATRESSIEETALKTNLEAAEEAARQMRLRDLAGLIVIDFIDMEERRNNAAVEKRLKEKLKSDRARIQIGRISGFGLLEMSRQRLRPGMIEATTRSCPHCHGTGRVRSDDSVALALLREIEEEGVRQRSREVLVVAPVDIANYVLNQKREHVALIEQRFGLSVRIEGDAAMISPEYRIERFKTASRLVPPADPALVAMGAVIETEDTDEAESEPEETASEEKSGEKADDKPRRKRRRRRGGRKNAERRTDKPQDSDDEGENARSEAAPEAPETAETSGDPSEERSERGARRVRRIRKSAGASGEDKSGKAEIPAPEPTEQPAAAGMATAPEAEPEPEATEVGLVEVPEAQETTRPRRRERVRQPAAAVIEEVAPVGEATPSPEPEPEPAASEPAAAQPPALPETLENVAPAEAVEAEAQPERKRRGWWSRAFEGS